MFFVDGVDYIPLDNLIFSISAIASSSQCVTVTIEEDNALEGTEDFSVSLRVDLTGASIEVMRGVTVTPDTLIVNITDDDGNDESY